MLLVITLKDQILPVFLSSRLLKDLSSFFSTIIYLFPLLRAGVIFTASPHYYMLLASVQAFTLLSFGDSFTEKWTLMSGGSEHEYSTAKLFLLWTSYLRELREGNFPWGSSYIHFFCVLLMPFVSVTWEEAAPWAWESHLCRWTLCTVVFVGHLMLLGSTMMFILLLWAHKLGPFVFILWTVLRCWCFVWCLLVPTHKHSKEERFTVLSVLSLLWLIH